MSAGRERRTEPPVSVLLTGGSSVVQVLSNDRSTTPFADVIALAIGPRRLVSAVLWLLEG